jgi:hypothetical protein
MITLKRWYFVVIITIFGWADILITLIGQPNSYWHGGIPNEEDIVSRWLLVKSPILFLIVGMVFWFILGIITLHIPKWIAFTMAFISTVSGSVAVIIWMAVIIKINLGIICTMTTLFILFCSLIGICISLVFQGLPDKGIQIRRI